MAAERGALRSPRDHRGLSPFLPILILTAQAKERNPGDHSYWDEWHGCDPTAVNPHGLTSILEVLAKAPTGCTWS